MKKRIAIVLMLAVSSVASASPSASWRVDTRGGSGPVAQIDLPDAGGKRRTAFVALEYARQCDPMFSFAEISGNGFGAPTSQSLLKDSKIGIILNDRFYTWHAAKINYTNGYEASFGLQNELVLQLLTNVSTLVYVTPGGEKISLPTSNFQKSFQEAIEVCRKRVQ